ncbi:uncharacterized protein LOC116738648 [Nasonia vitripennis]|uniref:Transposase domain-containing protein n=1 Tax=Nasonia vitripennis TaxID=7425 RepID=A0A7M7TEE2_NASVI|nr:uncharacterized protein LOC116738648 [Nasonia vitripennis]
MHDCIQEVLEHDEGINANGTFNNKFRTLEDFMQSKEFFEPIDIPMDKTRVELFLMLLKFGLVNSLSVSAMTNLFKMFNRQFSEPILPDTHYILDKLLNPQGNAEFHAVCTNCSAYIGKFEDVKSVKSCSVCHEKLDLSNIFNVSFFIRINTEHQIALILNIYEDHYYYVVSDRNCDDNNISDIYDGNAYRHFKASLPKDEKKSYATGIVNFDGTRKFECTHCTLWPLFLMINELPVEVRTKKLITCCLWIFNKKPDMNAFLNPFVDVVNGLNHVGIKSTIRGEERSIRLHVPLCVVDSPARCGAQGIHQFNGKCGCSWCKHPGVWAEGSMRYPVLESTPEVRNAESMRSDMLTATPDDPIDGVIGPSPLATLTHFDVVFGFVPDYLHCVLQGVINQFTEYYAKTMNANQIKEVDSIMMSITAYNQNARYTRRFSSRGNWSARERENFALFYSVPIFSRILSKERFYHWLLLVESLYILLQENITIAELNEADKMLHEFVGKTQQYFVIKAMTYNVHQLLHLGRSVLDWWPLWAHSTFSFEAGNHYILRATKCARGVTQQICRYVNLQHHILLIQERVYPRVSATITMFCDDILSDRVKNFQEMNGRTYFSTGSYMGHGIIEEFDLPETAMFYAKMVQNSCLYQTAIKEKKRSNDSITQLNDGTFIRILCFVVDDQTDAEITICNVLHTHPTFSDKYNKFQIVDKIEEINVIVQTTFIKIVCICMNIYDNMYICPLPNLLKY